jgi:hypothetical protein
MSEIFQALNENNFNPSILYTAKLSFQIDGAIKKILHNKQKLKQYMTTKPPLQKILQGILHTDESKQNHERTGSIKPQKKKRQEIRQ